MGKKHLLPNDPPGMNQAGNPSQDGQGDVDEEIGTAPALEEDGQLGTDVSTRVLKSEER